MRMLTRLARGFGYGRTLCLLLLIAFVALRVWDPPPVEALRLRTFDFYQSLKPREAKTRPVVIVDIDEASLAALGQWPWPRTVIADLVERLAKLGAAAIAFDVLFAEPDRLSPALAADAFRNLDEATRERLRQLPSNDEVLAATIARSRVVVGQSGLPNAGPQVEGVPASGFATFGGDPKPFLVSFPGLLRNLPILERAAAGRGLFTLRPERDGIVRRVPMVMLAQGQMTSALTLELLRVLAGAGAVLVRTDEAGVRSVGVPRLEVPTDANGRLFVYFAPHDQARYVSAKDVLEGRLPADRFDRRLVLIGTSAIGLLDIKTTPIEAAMPGVEVHAQVLENVLTASTLSYPNYAIGAELLAAVLVGLAIIAVAPLLNAAVLLALGALVAAALVAGSWYFYTRHLILLDTTFPLMASFAIYLTFVFSNYFREQVARQRIRSAFGQYLSPTLVEHLAQSPERLVLGGEERRMTVMFSDMRGFTSTAELYKDDPQGLTALMNRLLTPLTNAIIARQGTIDKYIGDAIMAFWNAPLDDPRHEANACAAALDMVDCLASLNAQRRSEAEAVGQKFVPLKIGIGLNSGPCVVGNMGSDLRFNYSVMGDTVNVSSRLEGQTKTYGVPVIVGSRTVAATDGQFATLEIDRVVVKGKTEAESIHALLGGAELAASPRFAALRHHHETMLAHYRGRDWAAAATELEAAQAEYAELGLSEVAKLYAARVRALAEYPPAADWDGTTVLESK